MEANQAAQPSIVWPLLAGLLIVLASAFFVTVEFAVVTVRRGQVEHLAAEGVVREMGYPLRRSANAAPRHGVRRTLRSGSHDPAH